eukprot:TRINITY_DN54674_c0_g1_i1.p1 TRINITY_DN54674_c0_g1~~TRINITY_DN54674_c0_g1_i1.p1  ORF type:complete len:707 (+),score=100.80 TRINITY_DN54674_c0_g1_i1:178-2298(+)
MLVARVDQPMVRLWGTLQKAVDVCQRDADLSVMAVVETVAGTVVHEVSNNHTPLGLNPYEGAFCRLAAQPWSALVKFLSLSCAVQSPQAGSPPEGGVVQSILEQLGEPPEFQGAVNNILRTLGEDETEMLVVKALRLASEGRGAGLNANGDPRTPGGCFMELGKIQKAKIRQAKLAEGEASASPIALIPRPYQEEVITKAREMNAIVVLPTGTGKTLVSVEIILHKLPNGVGTDQKAIYLEKTQIMVAQATDKIKEHLRAKGRTDLRVQSYDGAAAVPYDSWEGEKMHFHIQVMTPAILINLLEKQCVSISEIALLVVDEVHDCKDGHPYMVVMTRYADAKARGLALPQILGLTATPAYATSESQTERGIQTLEQNMDARLVQVELEKSSLEQHQPERTSKDVGVEHDESDQQLLEMLDRAMGELEDLLKDFVEMGKDSDMFPRWSPHYRELCTSVAASDHTTTARELACVLCACSEAMELLEEGLTGWLTAIAPLSASLVQLLAATSPHVELVCSDVADALEPFATLAVETASEGYARLPAKVNELVTRLLHTEADARTIVFVQTRLAARTLARWLGQHPGLQGRIKPASLIGKGPNGMTKSAQSTTRMRFYKGEINLLVATSVAEEGLDFDDCDLVVCMNSAYNARVRLQTQGRVRKPKGEYICIYFIDHPEQRGAFRSKTQAACLGAVLETRSHDGAVTCRSP